MWISGTVFQYTIGKGIDAVLGKSIERQLEGLKHELKTEIQRSEAGSTSDLHAHLKAAETQQRIILRLLEGKPSKAEMQIFKDQVTADFALVSKRLAEHDVRLDGHDTQIHNLDAEMQEFRAEMQGLQQRLATLEEFYPTHYPEVPSHLPTNPKIAILSLGEPSLAQAIEVELEDRLSAMELEASSGNNSLQVSDLLRQYGEDISVSKLVPLLAAEGFHALILVRIEVVGYRELAYLGRYSEATDARLRLNAYLLHGGRSLGRGWNTPVVYTAINADRKAEEALGDSTWEIAEEIRKGWQAQRASSGG